MLCRSASTGVLGTLLPAVSHPQTGLVPLTDTERSAADPLHHPQLAHVSTPRSGLPSPGSQHLKPAAEDSRSIDGGDWDFEGVNDVPWPRFQKVHSENDLQSLWRSSSWSGATFAAAGSLLSAPQARDDDGGENSGSRLSRRRRQPGNLRRHLSLSVILSGSSDSLGSDLDSAIPELVENSAEVSTGEAVGDLREVPAVVSGSFLNDSALIGMQYMGELGHKSAAVDYNQESAIVRQSSVSRSLDFSGIQSVHTAASSSKASEPSLQSGQQEVMSMSKSATTVEAHRAEVLERSLYLSSQDETFGPMFVTDVGIGNGGGGSGRGVSSGGGSGGGYGDYNGVEAQYRKMLDADPEHPLLLSNYAKFLHEVKRDPLKAEPYYERAILANPGDGEVLGHYAQLVWEVYKDEDRAGRYFDQALQACPDDCYLTAAYASFLWSSAEGDEPEHDHDSNCYVNSVPPIYGAAAISA